MTIGGEREKEKGKRKKERVICERERHTQYLYVLLMYTPFGYKYKIELTFFRDIKQFYLITLKYLYLSFFFKLFCLTCIIDIT